MNSQAKEREIKELQAMIPVLKQDGALNMLKAAEVRLKKLLK